MDRKSCIWQRRHLRPGEDSLWVWVIPAFIGPCVCAPPGEIINCRVDLGQAYTNHVRNCKCSRLWQQSPNLQDFQSFHWEKEYFTSAAVTKKWQVKWKRCGDGKESQQGFELGNYWGTFLWIIHPIKKWRKKKIPVFTVGNNKTFSEFKQDTVTIVMLLMPL